MKTITYDLVKSYAPCYDPKYITDDLDKEYTPREFILEFRDKVKKKEDILWVLLRNDFMSDKDMRLFAVWCAREALKLVDNPDPRSINACDVAERYANGEATDEELAAAWAAARAAARAAEWAAGRDAGRDAALAAEWAAEWAAVRDAARADALDKQIDKLLTYFE